MPPFNVSYCLNLFRLVSTAERKDVTQITSVEVTRSTKGAKRKPRRRCASIGLPLPFRILSTCLSTPSPGAMELPSPPTGRSCPARGARFKVVVSWLERSAVATGRAIGAACLDKTPLRGARPWFVCDACSGGRNCGRRGAGLYADGKLFACPHCCGLAYASRQQGPRDRGMDQARGITMPLARAPLRSR